MTDTAPAAPAPAPTPAATPAPAGSEEAALLALHAADPRTFEYAPYKDTGRTGAERLYDIRQARETASGDGTADDAADDDDITDADVLDLDGPVADAEGEDDGGDGENLDLSAYAALPEGMQLSETGEAVIGIVNEFCEQHGYGSEGRNDLFALHTQLIEAQNARLADLDKAAIRTAVATLGGKETYTPLVDTAKAVLKTWPKDLRDAVRDARTSDGRRLALMPEFVRVLAGMGGRRVTQPQDSRTSMQAELQTLDEMMYADIDAYNRRGYRGRDISASDRRLEIMRELASEAPTKPSSADLRAEERKLVALSKSDPDRFRFGGPPGQTPADRLHVIRMGRG